ncbi:cytochrome c biogenesis protein CcsA [Paenibacillus septentrionalis]|uniref:Cytochrome c biogenesis protein CcsA n=1 Tax=Paenibacillus septentrionalis TaxID=429342 RepID=A0ABW1UYR7_9BACL
MNWELWIYDTVVYIYALSLLFYFSDFIYENRRAKQLGTGLLVFVWMLSGGFLIIRFFSELQAPAFAFTNVDLMQLFSWIMITLSFIISRFYKIELIVFFVNIIGFSLFALNIYSSSTEGNTLDMWHATRELLYVHISLVISAYAILTVGALLAIMYLIVHYSLKRKKGIRWLRRFPSLEVIASTMERMVIFGFPLLVMSLAIALIPILLEGKTMLLFDVQILMSILALAVYGYFIYQRAVHKKPGYEIARLYLLAYAIQIINMLSGEYSSFH